jgi:hypothetical protein
LAEISFYFCLNFCLNILDVLVDCHCPDLTVGSAGWLHGRFAHVLSFKSFWCHSIFQVFSKLLFVVVLPTCEQYGHTKCFCSIISTIINVGLYSLLLMLIGINIYCEHFGRVYYYFCQKIVRFFQIFWIFKLINVYLNVWLILRSIRNNVFFWIYILICLGRNPGYFTIPPSLFT